MAPTPYRTNARRVEPRKPPPPDYAQVLELLWLAIQILLALLFP
jgi:hypothetical protein